MSDGQQVATQQSAAVRMANALPRVTRVELFPPKPTARDTLLVEATADDPDGDSYELRYRWSVNGKVLDDVTGNSLPPNRVKRGDELGIEVAAEDSDGTGDWFQAEPLRLGNSEPKITSQPSRTLATATRYEYAVQAADPDGDKPLRYSMVKGPAGMQVDLVSGVVSWEVPQTADGTFEIEIAVSDAYGGEARQAYSLDFHWQQAEPAAPADSRSEPERREE